MGEMWVMDVRSIIKEQLTVLGIAEDTVLTALGIRSIFHLLCFDYLS